MQGEFKKIGEERSWTFVSGIKNRGCINILFIILEKKFTKGTVGYVGRKFGIDFPEKDLTLEEYFKKEGLPSLANICNKLWGNLK